ncbi:hypothetical protein [Kamptonema sp. UHCC 0994]|uniref:hypothetical protein n=1 Tax=Kamptonema sp. UHCC 0994 TaxID=3031329 RepID=UPI0023B908DF|nr:hypothetical protein [Kamptonema sp. UHCC 0994]MDF0553901.1 hypothetical protein [Kamptonema sp. UHCC 0994]
MYNFPEPPIFLMFAGLLAAIASGTAFEAVLKQAVQEWSKNRSTQTLANLRGTQLAIPFLGMIGGVGFFLSSGLEIFGFPQTLSFSVSIPLTILTAWLVWFQLGKVLNQLERGGSQSLDLDSWS